MANDTGESWLLSDTGISTEAYETFRRYDGRGDPHALAVGFIASFRAGGVGRLPPADISKPLIPVWFRQPQRSDKLHPDRVRAIPAVVIVKNNSGEGAFGTFWSGSHFRFSPTMVSTFPTFSINVRENHRTELDNGKYPTKIKDTKSASRLATRPGFDPNHMNDNHVEDDLEFDFDVARYGRVETFSGSELPPHIQKVLLERGEVAESEHSLGAPTYDSRDDELPA